MSRKQKNTGGHWIASMELYADDSCYREDTMNLSELAEEYRLNAEEQLIFKEYTQNRFKDAKENKNPDVSFLKAWDRIIAYAEMFGAEKAINSLICPTRPVAFHSPETLEIKLYDSSAGKIPIISVRDTEDFERLREGTATFEEIAQEDSCYQINDIRRRTRVGMGTCQGNFCALRSAGLFAQYGKQQRAAETLTRMKEFLQGRWKGIRPVLVGRTLRETQMTRALYELSFHVNGGKTE